MSASIRSGPIEPTHISSLSASTVNSMSEAFSSSANVSIDSFHEINYAIKRILADHGDTVSVETKAKGLLKFGRNESVGTSNTTLQTQPSGILHETYVATNAITHISSSNSGDTQEYKVEGHTISGSNFTFSVQTVTLAGQTKTALTTPLARVSRIYNNGATDTLGQIYVYEDDTLTAGVPNTDAKVHLMTRIGVNNSDKASTTISSADYWMLTGFSADCFERQAAWADVDLEIRLSGKVFRVTAGVSVGAGLHHENVFHPYLIIPPNSDVRLTSIANATGTDVGGEMQGYLAIIT